MLDEKMAMLRGAAMFSSLADDDLRDVAQRLVGLDFEAGDMLFREGAPGRYICFLTAGTLEVWKNTEHRAPVVIAEIEPGRSVGEMSIIDGLTCSATVTAREPAHVLALTRAHFEEILKDNPRLGAEIYKGISRLLSMTLRQTTQELAEARTNAMKNQ